METVRVALAGNPNTGKTTIFNALTGSRQYIGNWPGVTVEKVEGSYEKDGRLYQVVDLPGTYDLCTHTLDERVARDYLVKERPEVVVVVLDTCNLERTLYLLLLILEMGLKVVAVFNMFDRATEQGLEVDLERFSSSLSILCVATVAHRQIGISELKEAITQTLSRPVGFSPVNYGEKVSKLVRELEEAVRPFRPPYPAAYVALKLVEHDPEMTEWLVHNDVTGRIKMMLESLKAEIKEPETFFWERRCGFIHGLVLEATRLTGNRQARLDITERLDRILTHPWMGLFVFLILMALVFEVVFHWSLPFQFFLNGFFNLLGQAVGFLLQAGRSPAWLVSLVSDAIFHGVGSVVSFLPNIFLLFLFFSVLEESGYMARVAFVADPLMHPLGLHGRSAISMLLGFGCNVPAIMSTRTLESPRDRILTILVNPFMSCSARLPVYLVFSSVFFPRYQGMVVFSLYFMGLAMAGLTAKIFTLFWFKEQSAPLIMELPPYQMPVWRNVVASAWNRALLFLHKAGTIIFLAMVVVWLLGSLPPGSDYASEQTFLGRFGTLLAPLLVPAGFGFWQAAVALLCGLVAKETVVGTLGALYGGGTVLPQVLPSVFTPVSAYAFLLMTLLYLPCLATMAVIKQEAGLRWAVVSTVWSLIVGWSVATFFYQVARFVL